MSTDITSPPENPTFPEGLSFVDTVDFAAWKITDDFSALLDLDAESARQVLEAINQLYQTNHRRENNAA